ERDRLAFFMDPHAEAGPFTGRVEKQGAPSLVELVGGSTAERAIAVTSIESSAQCAFAGFCKRVLHARRRDDLGESADARERATLVPGALEAAFDALTRQRLDDPERAMAAALAAAGRALGADERVTPLRREAIAQAVSDAAAAVADALLSPDPLRFAEA